MVSTTHLDRRVPRTVAEHPGLELCNTRAGWDGPSPSEYLVDYQALVAWASSSGVLADGEVAGLLADARRDPTGARRMVTEARAFRGTLHTAVTDRAPAELAPWFRRAVRASDLTPDASGRWRWDGGTGLRRPLWLAVLAAQTLLADHPVTAVRVCPGPGCGWVFLDPTGRRRWCVMAVCGNRAKARRHAARVRADRPDDAH